MKKLDVKDYSFAHLNLIMLLHYLVKCRSRILADYNNEFILGSACIGLQLGIKINGTYYRDVVLRQTLIPDIHAASGSELFVFQQYSATHHIAPKTQ